LDEDDGSQFDDHDTIESKINTVHNEFELLALPVKVQGQIYAGEDDYDVVEYFIFTIDVGVAQ